MIVSDQGHYQSQSESIDKEPAGKLDYNGVVAKFMAPVRVPEEDRPTPETDGEKYENADCRPTR